MPNVSVVIPTHNRAGMIEAAVADVLAQTYEDLEVLVIDDASTDETSATVEAIDDPRVRLVRLPENQRIAGARNAGLDHARGAWVAFHDDDDVWMTGKLEAQLALASEDIDVLYCPYAISRGGRAISHDIDLPQGDVFEALAKGWGPPLGSSIVLRREAVGDRRFDRSVEGIEDIDFWIEMAQASRWATTTEALVVLAKDAGARATHAIDRREKAIAALRAKWRPTMETRGLGAAWEQACDLHLTVARLEGPLPGIGARAGLARDLVRLPIGRRTRILGAARLALGHRTTDRLVDRWFELKAR